MRILLLVLLSLVWNQAASAQVPERFVDVKTIVPSIEVEMRYFSEWNFLGRVVNGYQANKCYLTKEAATALGQVQAMLEPLGYSLLVFDCYRPQRAVADFAKWADDLRDLTMQKIFYPLEPKSTLWKRGYIAHKSGHSRGSTVDLTIVRLAPKPIMVGPPAPEDVIEIKKLKFQEEPVDCRYQKNITLTRQLDMGTMFDCFSTSSNTASRDIAPQAQINRLLLKQSMEKFGFRNYFREWWHFTLKSEPYPSKIFDFAVQ